MRREEICSFESSTSRSESPQSGSQRIEQHPPPNHHPLQTELGQEPPEEQHYTPRCLLDLRLMHHYSVFAAQALSNTLDENVVNALKVDIPRLAFEHEFLMHAVLLVAMVHLCCVDNSAERLPIFLYRDQALRALRHAVTHLSSENIDALRGASVLLAAVSFPTDRWTNQSGLWVTNWMALALGQRNFRESYTPPGSGPFNNMESSTPPRGLYGCFADLLVPPVTPSTIQRALEMNHQEDDIQYISTLKQVAAELGRLISILKSPYETKFLEKNIKAWAFDVISPEFITSVQHNRPEALVVLGHYIALFRFMPGSWIYHGLPQHDIGVVVGAIDGKWKDHLSLPVSVIEMDDMEDAAALFATCLE